MLVRPDTVVRWQRHAWKAFWRWRSRHRLGRPRLSTEVRELIARMAQENPSWGSERIRGELLKLGIRVRQRSVQRYRRRGPARPPSQTWRTFLANHRPDIWAVDLLTVQTLTLRTLSVLLFITHGRRELVHLTVTASPSAAWIGQQVVEATLWGRQPRYLLRDRDAVYDGDFVQRAQRLGIQTLLSPVRASRANAVAERVIRTLRNECFDHLIINEQQLRVMLAEFVEFYNTDRPHRSLQLDTPRPAVRPTTGSVHPRPVLGGLHHIYESTSVQAEHRPIFPTLQVGEAQCEWGIGHPQPVDLVPNLPEGLAYRQVLYQVLTLPPRGSTADSSELCPELGEPVESWQDLLSTRDW